MRAIHFDLYCDWDEPLDFVMLSDHAEFLGTIEVCTDSSFEGYSSSSCVDFRENPTSAVHNDQCSDGITHSYVSFVMRC